MRRGLLCCFAILTISLFSCRKEYQDKAGSIQQQTPPPSMLLTGITKAIGPNIGGYFAGLPGEYAQGTKQHPLLLYIHGGGQFGNGDADLPNLLSEGIPALLDTRKFPASVVVQGTAYSFIVLAPQFKIYPTAADVQTFLDFARASYRIDSSRIYVTGFSIGGRIACDLAGAKAASIAAVVPIAGASNEQVPEKCRYIADHKLPIWAFHNQQDQLISVNETKNFITSLNQLHPAVAPKLTIFDKSTALLKHDAWTRATDPEYRENGMNIYEWMLQFKR